MSDLLPRNWAGFQWQSAYTQLPTGMYQRQLPTPVSAPELVVFNEPLAQELGLDTEALTSAAGASFLVGNTVIEGMQPIAQAYAGHQFGHFTILGDGRALLLGEHCASSGRVVDVQWKGAGPTPFSRGGDGRLALGPALREFLVSEAISALGIRTTRSLAVATSGDPVYREAVLRGAVLLRIASSHVRVGTFQYAFVTREEAALKGLVEYCIARHYPELGPAEPVLSPERVALFFKSVINNQAELVARWLSVGFIHGVMNTDNTTISGETIDFGPCAFLDDYDPGTVFSSIDRNGRYAFGQQPGIAAWNLARLGDTLIPLLGSTQDKGEAFANSLLQTYSERFNFHLANVFGAKVGIAEPKVDDVELVQDLLGIAAKERWDFHRLWLDLTDSGPDFRPLSPALALWSKRWLARLGSENFLPAEAKQRMRESNPVVALRNHRVEEALASAQAGDFSPFEKLLSAVRAPFVDSLANREVSAPPGTPDANYRTFCGT